MKNSVKVLGFLTGLFLTGFASAGAITVGVYGDSTTWGAEELASGEWIQSPSNVPAVLQSKYPAGTGVTVLNKGISGVTLPQLIIGAAPAKRTWAEEMRDSPAQIISLNVGINDANQSWETDFVFRYYLAQAVAEAQSRGKIVVLETSNPINHPLYNRLSEIALVTRTFAQENSLTLADHHLWVQTGLPNWATYLPDGVHPNSGLYKFKAENLYKVIAPVIAAQQNR